MSISIVVISKDEPALAETLDGVDMQAQQLDIATEVLVVDASIGRLDHIRRAHPGVRWIDFDAPPGVAVTIPHQRNAGVSRANGDIIVFTDAGCIPQPGWLAALVRPLQEEGERCASGIALSSTAGGLYDARIVSNQDYLAECPTINLAFQRGAFDAVNGFDETFEYGSDVDFSWRLNDAGVRIRNVPSAVVRHDWGGFRRQLRRSHAYGRARARLYAKHRGRLRSVWRTDPVVIAYPAFLLGLPLTRWFRGYPLVLILPAIRNRSDRPVRVIVDHLVYGGGVLREALRA